MLLPFYVLNISASTHRQIHRNAVMLMHFFFFFFFCPILVELFSVIWTEFSIIFGLEKPLSLKTIQDFFLNEALIFELCKLNTANQCCTGVYVMTSDLTNPLSWEDGWQLNMHRWSLFVYFLLQTFWQMKVPKMLCGKLYCDPHSAVFSAMESPEDLWKCSWNHNNTVLIL